MAVKGYIFLKSLNVLRPLTSGPDYPATPPAVGYPPSYGAYGTYQPDATTTGVPSGTVLSLVTGNITVTTANTVLDSLDVNGRIIVQAANVTILRCRVRGGAAQPSATSNVGLIQCSSSAVTNLVIQDCTLVADNPHVTWTGVLGHDFTAQRCDVSGTVDTFGTYNTSAPAAASGVNVLGNYCHALSFISPDPNHSDNRTHNDGVQIQGNTGIVIRGNTFDISGPSYLNNPATNSNSGYGGTSGSTGGFANAFAPAVGQGIALTPNVSDITCTIDRNWFLNGFRGIGGLTTTHALTATVTSNKFAAAIVAYPAGSGGTGGTVRRTIILTPAVSAPGLPTVNQTVDTTNNNTELADGSATVVWRQTP